MSEISRKEAEKALYRSLETDELVSKEAFARNGAIRGFQTFQVFFEADIWIHRDGVQNKTTTPQKCQVCTTENTSQWLESDVQTETDTEATVLKHLQTTGVPYTETRVESPKEGSHSISECSSCAGCGETVCQWCDGEGIEECYKCDGGGQFESRKPCPVCDNGLNYCDDCEGTGYVYAIEECRSCTGSGEQPCSKCRGDGQITCERCGQSGCTHSYDVETRSLEVTWHSHGLPSTWGADANVTAKTVEQLGLTEQSFTIAIRSSAETQLSSSPFEAAILTIDYGSEGYRGLVVRTSSGLQFVFDPQQGPPATTVRRKIADILSRFPIGY